MSFEYFYGDQADQFTFYRVPKILFSDERFEDVSAEAKVLYGILLDRMSLSQKNRWLDEEGRVFIIFTLDEVKAAIGCADQKAVKLLSELESKIGLIERKRQGLGRPNLIYVKNFVDNSSGVSVDMSKPHVKNFENHSSGILNGEDHEIPKSQRNDTDDSYTDPSKTDPYPIPSEFSPGRSRKTRDGMKLDRIGNDVKKREQYRDRLKKQLDYEALLHDHPYEEERIDELFELMLDVICSKRREVRIAGDDKPLEVVKARFFKLTKMHIEYVLSSMEGNSSKVKNIRQYLLTSLYNAALTMSNYYDARVRSDGSI